MLSRDNNSTIHHASFGVSEVQRQTYSLTVQWSQSCHLATCILLFSVYLICWFFSHHIIMVAIVPFLWAGLNHFVKKKTKNFNVEKHTMQSHHKNRIRRPWDQPFRLLLWQLFLAMSFIKTKVAFLQTNNGRNLVQNTALKDVLRTLTEYFRE